ncbi:MAG: PQQ-dependent sugar dehydrogenase [Zavarzinella sp.]
MLRRMLATALVVGAMGQGIHAAPELLLQGLKNPESVVIAFGGKVLVSEIGEFDKDGDGRIVEVVDGKATTFVGELNDPKGITTWKDSLYVTDKTVVYKVNAKGQKTVFAAAKAFPTAPKFLNDVVADPETGMIYVSDSGDLKGTGGAVYRIDQKGKVTLVIDQKLYAALNTPNGLALDGKNHLLMGDFGTGILYRIGLNDKKVTKIAEGFGGTDAVNWDYYGRLFLSDYKGGKIFGIFRPGMKPVLVAEGFQAAADICIDHEKNRILVPDMKAGTLSSIPAQIPGNVIDESPLKVGQEVAFPNIKWSGWKGETDDGKLNPQRPIVLTHAGDGTNRIFMATEHGVIHVFPNKSDVKESTVFLDMQSIVTYIDKQNEEGLLGLAFHPKYKENGEFFVFYTTKSAPLTNVLSRFRVNKNNPNQADLASEEVLLTFKKPFWNHNGGTICFGPDGYLYVTHGDGGKADDPFENGQNLKSLLGKVLRIDVDSKSDGKPYGIPKDNPFVGRADALPEIFAFGLRNIWRMSFDRTTGKLWAGDVGQNLYEEINIITKGGNYGWNRREGVHPFGAKGVDANKQMTDPIWEYHHDLGKSITGGIVYRGKALPELVGHYIYVDYVTGKLWALKYDDMTNKVVANRLLSENITTVLSFGEDEQGELYLLLPTPTGKGILRLTSKK